MIAGRDQFSLNATQPKKIFNRIVKFHGVQYSNEISSAVLSHGTIYLVCSSNF